MSRFRLSPYWKQRRDRSFDKLMDSYTRATDNDGWREYKIERLDWRSSSYMLIFYMNGRKRQVNIISECRERFGRLTLKVRDKIEASMPKSLMIHTEVVSFYAPYNPYNVGGFRYIHSVDETELEKWFQQVKLSDS